MTAKRQTSNSSGRTWSSFTMRNKLKRNKSCREPERVKPLALALAETRCPDEGESPAREGQRKTCCETDVKIAPIFLRPRLDSRRTESKDADLRQSVEKLQAPVTPLPLPPPPPPPPPLQHRSSASPVVHECPLSPRRRHLSPSSLRSLLEQIQTSNPAFPVQTVFTSLQKKRGLQAFGSSGESSDVVPTQPDNPLHPNSQQKKRRGGESSGRVSKRLRCSVTAEGGVGSGHRSGQCVQEGGVLAERKQPGSSKLSRSHRLKQRSWSLTGSVIQPELFNHSEPVIHHVLHREASLEDVLWTDKYSPQCSGEVIGNCGSVKKLQSWLEKWKFRADRDERRKMEARRDEDESADSWDCGDFQGEAVAEDDREEPLCNTMLITGPPGVGKTASVYACAQELGFKVFEVNCSSQRSGRHVLTQLKEATQSHLVETSGRDPLKPSYLNNYSTSTSALGKRVRPQTVTSTSKKKVLGRSGRKGKPNPAAATLTDFFKMKAEADLTPPVKLDDRKPSSPGSDQTVTPSKKTATSLILFEEVDVIFEDDVGFLGAIKSFMATTKRPVVLTTNDPLFRERFSCSLEEIIFKTPSAGSVCSYLQLVCLAEDARLELDDVRSLLRHTGGDVRRCLLQAELWVRGGGGRPAPTGGFKEPVHVQHLCAAEEGHQSDSSRPPSDMSCTATVLGLHPLPLRPLLNLLKCRWWSDADMNRLLRLLSESWRGGEPLLYNNLELLLPNSMSVRHLENVTPPPPHSGPQVLKTDVSPKAPVADRRPLRNKFRLSRRKSTVSADTSALKQDSQRLRSRIPGSGDEAEGTSGLDALADFFDLMSYLDSSPPASAPLSGARSPGSFVWTGAEVKDGLLDESNEEEEEEEGGSWSHDRLLDIKAAAEGLGCHTCWWRVSQAWADAHKLGGEIWDRPLPTSTRRQSLRFSFQPQCGTSVSHRRYDLSRKVLSSKWFSLLGDRRAVCVDYMPVLRSVCRSHRAQQQEEEEEEEPNSLCGNYLRNKHLDLSKSTIQLLAADFSSSKI